MSANAGGPPPPIIASANASTTTGCIAVSWAAARTSAGAPASPLLTCNAMGQWRLPANNASARARCRSGANSDAGSQAERYPCQELAHLVPIAAPPEVACRRARAVVGHDQPGRVLREKPGIPHLPGRQRHDLDGRLEGKVLRRAGDPVQERAPHLHRLLSVRDHDRPSPAGGCCPAQTAVVRPSADCRGARGRSRWCCAVRVRNAVSEVALIAPKTPPKETGSSWVRSVRRVTTPKLPPPPPLSAQNRLGMRAGIGDPHHAIGGDDLGFQQPRRRQAVALREAAEPAAENEPRHADRRAAPALHVAAGLGRHRLIDLHPEGAGVDGHGRLRGVVPGAAVRDKPLVEHDAVHRPRPEQQRIRRTRGALVAVPPAFHDQPQMMLAGEIDRRDDVGGGRDRHRIDAGGRRPGIEPARGLCQCRLLAQVVRIV